MSSIILQTPSFVLLSADYAFEVSVHIILVLALVAVVLGLQTKYFYENYLKIKVFSEIFLASHGISLTQLYIPKEILNTNSVENIIKNSDSYKEKQQTIDGEEVFEVPFLISRYAISSSLDTILYSINNYLIKNRGAVSDFHLMKDIVDRNCDNLDEEIQTALPAPLYLGLMGTMLGIILSVGVMTITGDIEALFNTDPGQEMGYNAITVLLGGVGLAMISSFTGLLLTMLNSVFTYKGVKQKVETQKNEFFTFLQTELLPVLSQNATSSLHKLEQNLSKFNENFAQNNRNFNETLGNIHHTFQDHAQMVQDIKDIDIKNLARFNAKVLKELRESTEQFEKFNLYIGLVNVLIENADKLNMKLNHQLDRTQSIEQIAEKLNENTLNNKEVIDFMGEHFTNLRERTALFNNSIATVDVSMQETIEELKINTTKAIRELHEHTLQSVAGIQNIQLEQVSAIDKNKNLFDNLQYLKNIDKGFGQLNASLKSQQDLLAKMNQKMADIKMGSDTSSKESNNHLNIAEYYSKKVLIIGGGIFAVAFLTKEVVMFVIRLFV